MQGFQEEFQLLEKDRLSRIKTALDSYIDQWPKVFLQSLPKSRETVAGILVDESSVSSVSLLNTQESQYIKKLLAVEGL